MHRVDPRTRQIHISEGEHSTLGPSSSERWIKCTPSLLLTKNLPNTTSTFAAEGTAAHTLSEICRESSCRAHDFFGWRLTVSTGGEMQTFFVNKDMADSVQEFVDWCKLVPGLALYEPRVQYERWVPGGFGTLDDARIEDWLTTITDFKHGKGVQVGAQWNSQMMLYALGVYEAWKHIFIFDTFRLRICQPRRKHRDTWEIGLPELLRWADSVAAPQAEKARRGLGEKVPGKWCQFCKYKMRCDARKSGSSNNEPEFTAIED